MKFTTKSTPLSETQADTLILGVFANHQLTNAEKILSSSNQQQLQKMLKAGDLKKELGSTLVLHQLANMPFHRIILVNCGKTAECSAQQFLKIVTSALTALRQTASKTGVITLTELTVEATDLSWKIEKIVCAARDLAYRFDQLKSSPSSPTKQTILFPVQGKSNQTAIKKAIKVGEVISDGIDLNKNLGNLPGNVCTPEYLAQTAKKLATQFPTIKTQVLEQKQLEKAGMGALLAVARGSTQPPKLIVMHYQGGRAKQAPIVLIGKGVTFDAGGISLKPPAQMDEMKYDMMGAASVIATLQNAAALELPLNLVVIVPATENLPGGNATKPGDIVTSLSGQTIEILNTDAEGRLILCDALTYATRFKPQLIIDVATLTGAMVVALGSYLTGVFSNQSDLAEALIQAGKRSIDAAWHMPMLPEYNDELKSNFADMANIGGRYGGSSIAACFLGRFVDPKTPWAHLDIAGTAWRSGSNKGATGRPVSLLTEFLRQRC